MNRRNFLQALGFGGSVTALSACGVDDNLYYTPVEHIFPYVTRPEQVTPGTNSNFATTIGTGPRAWPAVAVHRDGRIINVGANRLAPLPAAVPSSQLLDLQRHYSPDRLTQPQKGGQPIAWKDAVDQLTAGVSAARAAKKRVVWLGPYLSGTLAELLKAFTGGNALFWEPLGLESEALAAKALFGADAGLPRYSLTGATYVLSFGAAFLNDAWGNAGIRTGFAKARHAPADGTVARYTVVGPHKDQSGSLADEWLACTPGTEALVAMGIAKALAETRAYQGPARPMIDAVDLDAVSKASGVPKETIQHLAVMFSGGGAVAIPGGVSGANGAATELAAAVYVLNVIADQPNLFSAGGYRGPIHSYADLQQLMTDLEAGTVGVLILDDVDPVHALPDGERFKAAMAKAGLVVSTSSHPSESLADLVLPTHDVFEDWGDEEPWAGFRLVRQPGARPLKDTRSLGDIVLDVWRAVDAATAPQGSWHDHLRGAWAKMYSGPSPADGSGMAPPPGSGPAPTPNQLQRWWEQKLTAGFEQSSVQRRIQLVGTMPLTGAATFTGSGPYFLHVYPHHYALDGRYANEPWAWEIPDPMTGQVWDTWALVHPDTAAALGVRDNDLIKITTDTGSMEVGVEVHPCVRPDVIAVPMGGGHTKASGRYADSVGQNVARLLAPTKDASGALVWQQAKCSVTASGTKADLVSLFGSDSDHDRGFAAVVDAGKWTAVKDEPQDIPGHLTGRVKPKMDSRLEANEAQWHKENPTAQPEANAYTGFYPVPDHPTYRFAMTIDANACNGCGACIVACNAENNIPTVGKWKLKKRRQMQWIRMDRFFADHTADGSPSVHFVPVLCQQCGHAPCESVCPVLATYHTIDGLNAMVYNRCVGTRYCSNACPYSIRRFNYHTYLWPEPFNLQLNPDVSARTMGVMEKCTFCVQRIRRTKSAYRDIGFTNTVPNEALEQLTACAEACPSQAITFGNLLDPESTPNKTRKSGRNYFLLPEVNTFPAINYLARASFNVNRKEPEGEAGESHHPPHAEPAEKAGGR